MAEKLNIMVIKVDLQCGSCYKKIKKLLCKFPEIRDQIYDEKQNTVTVTVSSCCTERVHDKLYCKGGKTIKNIEIKTPQKPKEPEKKKEAEKPKVIEKLKPNGKADMPKETEKLKLNEKADKPTADQKKPSPMAQKSLEPAHGAPIPIYGYPTFYPSGGPCCGPCCNGYGFNDGLCNQAYGSRPMPGYDNYGYGQYGHFGSSRDHYVSPHEYFSEENTSACTIM